MVKHQLIVQANICTCTLHSSDVADDETQNKEVDD